MHASPSGEHVTLRWACTHWGHCTMLHTACKLIFISTSLYCEYHCVVLDDLRCGTKATKQMTGNKISHYCVGEVFPCANYLHLLWSLCLKFKRIADSKNEIARKSHKHALWWFLAELASSISSCTSKNPCNISSYEYIQSHHIGSWWEKVYTLK